MTNGAPHPETTAGQRRYAQAQQENPDHPYLQREWRELSDPAKAGWERVAKAEEELSP